MTSTTKIGSDTKAAGSKDPQAAFQEKLAGYITRHLHGGTEAQLPAALRTLATTPGISFDSSLLMKSKGKLHGIDQPAMTIIDMNTGPNPELVLHHPRKPNDGYVLLAAAIGTEHPLTLTQAIDISTPALAALKTKLKNDRSFMAAVVKAGFKFADLKFVVGDAIGKKDGGDFAGEFTDAGAGRYGVYVPGDQGQPAFAKNFIVHSQVTLERGPNDKLLLRAVAGAPKEEKL